MLDKYAAPSSCFEQQPTTFTKKKFWCSVGLACLTGALISSLGVYKYLYDEFGDALALSFISSDIHYAERDIHILSLSDSELRCELSKVVGHNIGRLNGYNIAVNPISDRNGFLEEIIQSRVALIDLYKDSFIWEHAQECGEGHGSN